MLSSYPSGILHEYTVRAGWNTLEYELPRSAGGSRKVEVLTVNFDPGRTSASYGQSAA